MQKKKTFDAVKLDLTGFKFNREEAMNDKIFLPIIRVNPCNPWLTIRVIRGYFIL